MNSKPCKPNKIPSCCLTCGHYLPQFYRVLNKQCAAFGTVEGVKRDCCGAWCRRIEPNAASTPQPTA